jgi:amino-acid N-acetyltransferase
MSVIVRSAQVEDSEAILKMVEDFARRNLVLPRSFDAIRASIEDWIVVFDEEQLLGCGSLRRYSADLCEVRSLMVLDELKGQGFGRTIVRTLIQEARSKDYATIFALTRVVPFFERLGFERCDRTLFPEKIWADCVHCPSQDNCDEFAVALALTPNHGNQPIEKTIIINGENHARIEG